MLRLTHRVMTGIQRELGALPHASKGLSFKFYQAHSPWYVVILLIRLPSVDTGTSCACEYAWLLIAYLRHASADARTALRLL